jgi:predicted small metal-binding protein
MKYDYRCHTAGARPCSFRTETNDENELRRQIERHLVEVHRVDPPTKTVVNYLMRTATEGAPSFLR